MISAAQGSAGAAAPSSSATGGITAVRNIHPGIQVLLAAAQVAQQAADVMLGRGDAINIIV